jgi:hypothetical protein
MALMASETDVPAAKTDSDIADFSIVIAGGIALALAAMFVCVVPLAGNIAGARDFVVYWATGQQLAHHANPYDPESMGRIERSAGLAAGYGVLYMRNPPWGLALALPLGFIGLRIGALLWSMVLIACLAASVRMLWLMQGRPRNQLHWLALSFAPALVCLIIGQTSLFALLGLVLFLRLHGTRPFLAGMSLWLCGLKPHLFVPFAVVLLAWIAVSKSFKIFAGASVAMAASCALTDWIDPRAWAEYSQMLRASGIEKEFIPCLSVVLSLRFSPSTMWLQYLTPVLCCAWAMTYFWPRRHSWDWTKQGSVLMLASIFAAPYCWIFDQVLVLPALLHGVYLTKSRWLLAVLGFASTLMNIGLLCGIRVVSPLYLITAPAWFAWYLFATGSKRTYPEGTACGVATLDGSNR